MRKKSGGIPIGFKISAQHIEEDIEFAVQASADYIILDGRGGGTGAAPLIFRDNINIYFFNIFLVEIVSNNNDA